MSFDSLGLSKIENKMLKLILISVLESGLF